MVLRLSNIRVQRPFRASITSHIKPVERIITRSRPEGIRQLRSDGTPNWSQRIKKWAGDIESLAKRPVISVQRSSTVMDAAESIASYKVRGLPVLDFNRVYGVVMATDIVNYLGGGIYYDIIVKRHNSNIFKALSEEKISSIMSKSPTVVFTSESLEKVLELMVSRGIGFIPVVYEDGEIYGVITEHDIVAMLQDKKTGIKVSSIMSYPIVAIDVDSSLRKVAETMIKFGFRRIILASDSYIEGFISAKNYVSFFGSHRAFSYLKSTSIDDILNLPATEILDSSFATIDADSDVGEACNTMLSNKIDWLLVVKGEEAIGIVTERDILVALALESV